jgi:hypothetical protein
LGQSNGRRSAGREKRRFRELSLCLRFRARGADGETSKDNSTKHGYEPNAHETLTCPPATSLGIGSGLRAPQVHDVPPFAAIYRCSTTRCHHLMLHSLFSSHLSPSEQREVLHKLELCARCEHYSFANANRSNKSHFVNQAKLNFHNLLLVLLTASMATCCYKCFINTRLLGHD